ncbi:mitochondrial carrier protein [Spathaspora passalidarum NRRL Y-27907]|uniref:Mitochondrial thiamine pyrophosphate carrier 1 n=1 Tax=Spathaspora passalidarum (strain NRRL Y-27907 / 11-Y1) TaxID=619300 RepID=G3AGU7_SPAPN|nr:mitochondrial carrier protein [Spathaspora passalidarum NRRL Y-27907]EGW35430.1 mitochondrial carrier protein [Spathaspora passalidarum NRRL Y-27907]
MSIVVEDKEEELWQRHERHEPNQPPRYLGFVAGMASGVMKNVVGHPFDTVKVRLQTAPAGQFRGPIDCVLQTLRREGPLGFYKGFTPPLVGWVLMDSVMLGSLHVYRRLIKENVYPDQEKLPLMGHVVAGLGSGLTVSFVAAPIEQFKARLQIQYNNNTKLYTGPIDVATKLYKVSGIRGIYSGLLSTMIFRTNFVFWWGSYELFTQWFEANTKLSKPAINFWSGGLSATVFWIFAYPADVVKQTIMTDSPHAAEKKFPRWIDAVKYIYRERGGISGFTRGFGPSILRSFPANAAALAAFEAVMRFLH